MGIIYKAVNKINNKVYIGQTIQSLKDRIRGHKNEAFNHISKNCPFHQELSASLTKLILKEVVDLNTRIELLTKRNIRDKLVSYFNLLSSKTLYKTITIPFSYTDLADYLSIDRSAMSRELKYLEDENFIKRNGKKISLLYK